MTVVKNVLDQMGPGLSRMFCSYIDDRDLRQFGRSSRNAFAVVESSWGERIVRYTKENPNGMTAQVYQRIHERVPIELTTADKANEQAKWLYRQVKGRARQLLDTQTFSRSTSRPCLTSINS